MSARAATHTLLTAFAAMTVAVSTAIGSTATAAHADPTTSLEYVNLGDSYSAASGVAPQAPDSPPLCSRSTNNFAHILARRNNFDLTDVSCGGASTSDFFRSQNPGTPPQLDALSPRTQLVTMMIGGNDGSVFAGTVARCIIAAATTKTSATPCKDQYGPSIVNQVRTQTFPNLVRALSAVRARAPRAHVMIISYPWLMPATVRPCPGMPVAPGDGPYTRELETALNESIRRAATQTGVQYVDATTPSVGHDSCQPADVRWIEPIVGATQPVPVHPNARGARALADITARAMNTISS